MRRLGLIASTDINATVSILIVLAVAVVGAAVVFLYVRYRRWPPVAWAKRVRRYSNELRARRDALLNPPASQRSAAEKLADELFAQQKRSIQVDVLTRYKGIGPKTVEWLEGAGIRTLAQAEEHVNAFLFKKKIDNVGEAREEAIAYAVKQCLIEERQRFDTGRSPEGQAYLQQLEQMSATERERAAAKQRELTAIGDCLAKLAPLEALAREVHLSTYLTTRSVPGLTDEVLLTPLPEVEIVTEPVAITPVPSESVKPQAKSDKPLPGVAKLQAFARFGLLAAKADGRVAQVERGRIRAFLGEQFGSDPVLLRHIDPTLEQAEADLPEEGEAIAALKEFTAASEWTALYDFAVRVIDSGGERTERERQFLERLAMALGLEGSGPNASPSSEAPAPAAEPSPREVLGIPADAEVTADLVRRKYTMLWQQVCPEKAAVLGPEFAAMAEAKRAAIRAAAEALLAPLNEPLERPAPPPPKDLRHNPELDDLFGA